MYNYDSPFSFCLLVCLFSAVLQLTCLVLHVSRWAVVAVEMIDESGHAAGGPFGGAGADCWLLRSSSLSSSYASAWSKYCSAVRAISPLALWFSGSRGGGRASGCHARYIGISVDYSDPTSWRCGRGRSRSSHCWSCHARYIGISVY